jgi:DNA polymerase-1
MKRGGVYSAPRGKILAEADYGSIEFRLCAWYAKARGILDNYAQNPDWDAHSWFARPFYGMPEDAIVEKSKRQVAKSANFSLWYCGYWKTVQNYAAKERIKLSQEDCERAYATWHALIPEAAPWWQSVEAFVKEHGYIETPTGRRRNFGKWEHIPYDMRGDVQRESVNMLAQSFSGDITWLALANCHASGLPINHTWYDAVYFELDEFKNEGQKTQFEETVRDCMVARPLATLREEFGVDLDVPLTIEISYKKEA